MPGEQPVTATSSAAAASFSDARATMCSSIPLAALACSAGVDDRTASGSAELIGGTSVPDAFSGFRILGGVRLCTGVLLGLEETHPSGILTGVHPRPAGPSEQPVT
jgi:hypothetical protein